jgi:hypothetical protein
MAWTKPQILRQLKQLYRQHANLSYNALAGRNQPLLSAAAYHFGSYRRAVEKAGITYADITRKPRWTKQAIIVLIKDARRSGKDLNWSAVTRSGDELSRAAFASLQPRLFGRWDRALHAAGLDADDVSLYRTWDRNTVLFELRSRARDNDPLNSGAVQQDDPALHAAAVRRFGDFETALRAAGFEPDRVRRRRRWSKDTVIRALRAADRRKTPLSDSAVRQQYPALHGASVRLFGTYTAARSAARRSTGKKST